jgi:hypothetical protein
MDLALPSFVSVDGKTEGAIGILYGMGNGHFEDLVSIPDGDAGGTGLAVADLDGDGWKDLVVSDAGLDVVTVLMGSCVP